MSDKPIKAVAKKLSIIIPAAELSTLGNEWKLYMSKDISDTWYIANGDRTHIEEISYQWIDCYWSMVLAMKNTQGELKYKTLTKVVQTSLTLSHGHPDVE